MVDDVRVKVDVTEDESRMTFSGPAVLANRFFVSAAGGVVRITFGEQDPITLDTQFRSAVALQPHDAIELYKLLAEMMSPYEMVIRETKTSD